MQHQTGFDNEKYLREQTAAILDRAKRFGNKLYLEFGGKLVWDFHAARVLPGFDPNVKLCLLQRLKDQSEILVTVYAGDLERGKVRTDFGLSYAEVLQKEIDDLRAHELVVRAVVITRCNGRRPVVQKFKNKLEHRGLDVYIHRPIEGYPNDVDRIVSPEGYGANPHVETEKPVVVVTAPGPGSGKLATCLNQVYHEYERGVEAGYAKFETFPIWNLPLEHPVNVAYEAATADIGDFNQVDPFHLQAYDETAVNYNRDVEAFPVVKKIVAKILGSEQAYQSPTDMGVNRAGFAICNDQVCQYAALQEVIRRFFWYSSEFVTGITGKDTVDRIEQIMRGKLDLKPTDRLVVSPARSSAVEARVKGKGHGKIFVGAAMQLRDGTVVTGKNSPLLHASSALILNAVKKLAQIPAQVDLLSRNVIDSIATLKRDVFNSDEPSLDLEETLIALSISAPTNPTVALCMEKLKALRACEMHMTHIPTPGDEAGLRRLGIHVTSDPHFSSRRLFIR